MSVMRRMRSGLGALLFAGLAITVCLAQVHPQNGVPRPARTMLPMPTLAPITATPAPSASASPNSRIAFPRVRPITPTGRLVPLSMLARLPAKTALNTAYILKGGVGRRPMMANGATITYAVNAATPACGSATGTLIPLGCDVLWMSTGLTGGDTFQDYYIPANSGTATAYGGTYTGGGGAQHDTPQMTPTGTYVIGTYDTTKGQWLEVVYLTVGAVNVFGTYADSNATTPQQTFTAANGTNVYVNATGLTQGQHYVVYFESNGSRLFCEYIAPPGTGTPNPNGPCDPTASSGIVAVVGAQNSAAVTAVWPLSSTTPTGTYAVVLYDLDTSTRLAMRQMTILGTGHGTASLVPVAGNGALGANWPTAPPAPGATTKFAFDNTSEQSDSGFAATLSGLAASKQYTYSIYDPVGQVQVSQNGNASAGGVVSKNYNFSNTQSPYNYISNVSTLQMLNTTTNAIDLSQAYQILGYAATTQFQNPGTSAYSTAIVLPAGGSVTDNLQFTNSGDTFYGVGNGDPLKGIAFNTGATGVYVTLACGAACTTETDTDSAGQSWTVTLTTYGGGANKGSTITAYPQTTGNTLAINGYLKIPNITFYNVPGNSGCQTGCSGLTAILPADGASWSQNNNSASTNTVYFTNGFSATYAGTASVTHVGYRDSGAAYHAGYETHGYLTNTSHGIYNSVSPFTATSGNQDVYAVKLTNNTSAGGGNITKFNVTWPTAYSPGGTTTAWGVDAGSPTSWTTCGATGDTVCFQTGGGNNGIAPGASQTMYMYIGPAPPASFSYTDFVVQAATPAQFALTATGTFTAFVPDTSTFDTTSIAAYSLTGNLITPGFSPTSEGQNTDNSVTINVQNASTAQDPYPDYLDMVTIDLPTANPFASLSGMPAGWSLLGTSTPVAGTTRYWFGLCAAQFVTADGPPTNPPPVNTTTPACSVAVEQSSISPGSSFTVTGTLQTATSNISATMHAHGANVGGWSSGHTFTLNVTAVSAAAGFNGAGGYPTATTVTSPQTPQIGGDSDTTYGNVFTYVIKNTSGAGQNLTSAKIVIPGLDVSAVLPADGTAWTLENTPSISGAAFGCSVTSSVSANRTGTNNGYGAYNGGITIGGGSCAITPGNSITVTFDAKAPYTVNDSYQFPTTVNAGVSASEIWSTDTIVQIVLSATLSIVVDPSSSGPGGSTPSVVCALCSYNIPGNEVDFSTINNLQTATGSDVVRISVYTDAGPSNSWKLYVSASNNPANTGAPTNELLTEVDKTNSLGGQTITGWNFDATTYTVIPTGSNLLLTDGSGIAARRTPFDTINS